jgi:hypothetical protein
MSGFPKIKGIKWMSEDFPDIITVDVNLVNRAMQEMDIPGVELPETPSVMYIDLSLLAGLNPWYPKGSEEPSETECSVDVNGISNFVANVKLEHMLEAWIFYKRFKYSRKV